MKTITADLRAHLAGNAHTMATCWLVKRTDGTVFAFTDHDQNIVFDLEAAISDTEVALTPGPAIDGTGSQTYLAASGFTASSIASAAGLQVDTGEASGMLSASSITDADVRAGLWDHASIVIFQVNWADLTMGALIERVGHLGEISTERGRYKAEWRGLLQAYSASIGELTSPFCNAILGDARCTKDLTAFTVTGTVDSAEADRMTIHDAARTEAGPATGIAISGITNANPGVVTMASAGTFAEGDAVMLSGIVGPTALNGTTFIRNLSGATWELPVDTTDTDDYPAYVGSGVVTPIGGTNGYFDYGLFTLTSGANAGISREVKSYVPGQWVLQLPMPYDIEAGATYTMIAGCNHTRDVCRDTFDNIVNFRGQPFLPGIDKMIQVGRHK